MPVYPRRQNSLITGAVRNSKYYFVSMFMQSVSDVLYLLSGLRLKIATAMFAETAEEKNARLVPKDDLTKPYA
jgi:hypothetical protein